MDINQWKLVLFDWIKAADLIDVCGALEHVEIETFFERFYRKIHSKVNDCETISCKDFLKETYPDFDVLYDETSKISSQDYVYIFSLFLHYSCVQEKNEFFQTACTKLYSRLQLCVAKFLEFIVQQKFTKEIIRTGIKQAILTSPQTKYFSVVSPLRTPRKSDISPPTPSNEFINSKLKELKLLKAQLENERFEKNMLEVEVKENQEKINNLVKKCKDLSHEIQSLKSSTLVENDSENLSPNKAQREYQLRKKMQKEIEHREDLIADLKHEVEDANAVNKKYQQKINSLEKQMFEMRLKMRELDASVDDLVYNMSAKDQKIVELEEERKELLEFINETRSSPNAKDDSSGCLDFSFSTTLYTTSCSDFSENLAKSVVDVQLKEKESEITKLNEVLSSTNKIKNDLELRITELSKSMKNLENELSEVKTSKSKLFEEKSSEIQALQNQLNTVTMKNKEIEREIGLKQKINLKMIEESDSHKIEVENLKEEIAKLKNQKMEREKEYEKLQNDLKITAENRLKEALNFNLLDLSKKTLMLDENIQKHIDDVNFKLQTKEEKILELTKLIGELKNTYESLHKEYEEKLMLKTNEIALLNIKLLEREEEQIREKIYSDELASNNEILAAKLQKARGEKAEQQKQLEKMMEDKRKYYIEMQEKFEGCKAKMNVKYNETVAENNSKYEEKLRDKDRTIKNLSTDLEQEKRENQLLLCELRFLQKNENGNCVVNKNIVPVTPFITGETFDNAFLNDMKNGTFEDTSSICSSSIFQQRNLKYPLHLRDSYAIGEMDKHLTEQDMKSGAFNSTEIEPQSPLRENHRKKKQGTAYQRPGPQTPSKYGRVSITPNLNVLKDTTNTENANEENTPSRIKSFFSILKKNKDELNGKRAEKYNRTLTPRRLRNQKDKMIVLKDTDSDECVSKCSRKNREKDRKEKRDMARDLNRPKLNDINNGDTTICSSDTEWIEEEYTDNENVYEKHSNTSKQHDKSLEYIKNRENFRKRQQKMRRRSFTNNRKSSTFKNQKISRTSSDDWDKYKSCASLRSESSFASNLALHTPKKTLTRNFINTHFAEVNRLSDYNVPSKRLELMEYSKDDFWGFNWKDIQKPFPIVVISMLKSPKPKRLQM